MERRRFGHVRQLPSGRWQASYAGPDGDRYLAPHTFTKKRDAEKWIQREEGFIETGEWFRQQTDHTPLFRDFCEEFINTQTTRDGSLLKPTTKQLYRTLLTVHLSRFHQTPLHEIDTPTVRKWWAESITDQKLTSRSRAYKLLSATLARAADDGLITHNPCTIKGAHSAVTGREIVVPTIDEVQRIIDHMNPRYKMFTMFLANSGLRFGEAAALERDDLVMDAVNGAPAWNVYGLGNTSAGTSRAEVSLRSRW